MKSMETAVKNINQIIQDSLNESISYDQYNELIHHLVDEEKTTGESQHEDLVYFTKLNAQRTKRLNKTSKVDEASRAIVTGLKGKYTWIVLTESWCGDAAQILPLFNKLVALNTNIDLRLVLRDEHSELMDEFLTNGGKSIPKLIMLNEQKEVVGSWGPRPAEAQTFYDIWKNNPNKPPYREFQVDMQKWYLTNKGLSTFKEVSEILKSLV
jgi:thiol-disulfide isomerase/thioredoxin